MKKLLVFVLLGSCAIFAFMLLGSCTATSKNKKTDTVESDSTTWKQLENQLRLEREKTARLESIIRESKFTEVIFQPADCDTAAIKALAKVIGESNNLSVKTADSLLRVLRSRDNKIRLLADGTTEASGQISSVRQLNSSLQSLNIEYKQRIDSFARALETEKNNYKYKKTESETKVRRGWPWYIWFIIGYLARAISMYIYRNRGFIISFIKNRLS